MHQVTACSLRMVRHVVPGTKLHGQIAQPVRKDIERRMFHAGEMRTETRYRS